jgi:hypothetical protein
MSSVTLRSLRPELAIKLSELEVGAALLHRDIRLGSATLAELGLAPPPLRSRLFDWARARGRTLTTAERALCAALTAGKTIDRVLRSDRLAAALRLTGWLLAEGLACCVTATAILATFTIAIAVLAPPV